MLLLPMSLTERSYRIINLKLCDKFHGGNILIFQKHAYVTTNTQTSSNECHILPGT